MVGLVRIKTNGGPGVRLGRAHSTASRSEQVPSFAVVSSVVVLTLIVTPARAGAAMIAHRSSTPTTARQ